MTDPPAGIAFMNAEWDRPWDYAITRHGFTDGGNRVAAPTFESSRNPTCRACGKRVRGKVKCACAVPAVDTQTERLRARAHFVARLTAIFAECRRVLVPGAHAVVWALPRTSHWTATALEDAGFEIRDVAVHLQAQGFPKSKALLKPAAEHWILCRAPGPLRPLDIDGCRVAHATVNGGNLADNPHLRTTHGHTGRSDFVGESGGDAPVHAAGRWPANATLEHAHGCELVGQKRVATTGGVYGRDSESTGYGGLPARRAGTAVGYADPDGAETVDDWRCAPECPVRLLDEQSGIGRPGEYPAKRSGPGFGSTSQGTTASRVLLGQPGGASRFFFCSKAKGAEREGNPHPTAKPVDLMRWLVRLVTPVGGVVLDPFMGSGTTGVAAVAEARGFVGIEREAEYAAVARARIAAALGPLFAAKESA